ncbi:MAG: phosphate signaling complex protein PhoU [Puniceicoccales bacterium]|jgi:phosphate transport system protein|nr:phosphate signaling complex protein PhoU [Puniceicoccales bacterium]
MTSTTTLSNNDTNMERYFHAELKDIKTDILKMGEASINMVRDSIVALRTNDRTLALQVRGMDDTVDELEKKIDREAVRYLTLFGPVGADVRLLMAARDVSHDLERIADEASGIARRITRSSSKAESLSSNLLAIPKMAELAVLMLEDALDVFFRLDAKKAEEVISRDDEVDYLYRENYQILFGEEDFLPLDMITAVELMFISKSIERIADHATNIAEHAVFLGSGEDIRHRRA